MTEPNQPNNNSDGYCLLPLCSKYHRHLLKIDLVAYFVSTPKVFSIFGLKIICWGDVTENITTNCCKYCKTVTLQQSENGIHLVITFICGTVFNPHWVEMACYYQVSEIFDRNSKCTDWYNNGQIYVTNDVLYNRLYKKALLCYNIYVGHSWISDFGPISVRSLIYMPKYLLFTSIYFLRLPP